jgi:hypothetical protein
MQETVIVTLVLPTKSKIFYFVLTKGSDVIKSRGALGSSLKSICKFYCFVPTDKTIGEVFVMVAHFLKSFVY